MKSPKPLLIFLLLLLPWLFPADAWACWGSLSPGGSWPLLERLPLLPADLQTLLAAYPHDYLYGCISADITLGKKYTHYLQHCHSSGAWATRCWPPPMTMPDAPAPTATSATWPPTPSPTATTSPTN